VGLETAPRAAPDSGRFTERLTGRSNRRSNQRSNQYFRRRANAHDHGDVPHGLPGRAAGVRHTTRG
jgi:hypothetical protein